MRVIDVLGFVLIAGIFHHSYGAGTANRRTRVPSHVRLLGYLNTTMEDIEKFDEDMCTKNGGPGAIDIHKRGWARLNSCMHSVYFEAAGTIYRKMQKNMSREAERNYTWEGYCEVVPSVENCLKNITETMKVCLDPEKHENANIIYTTISSVMRFMCQDRAARFKSLMTVTSDQGQPCSKSAERGLQNCANQTIFSYIQSTISDGAAIGSNLGAVHLLTPDLPKCKVLEKFRDCALGVLNKCTTVTELFASVFNEVKEATTCNRFLKSNASPTTVVNILSIITWTVTMMFLRFY